VNFSGRIAVVVGGASGIGAAVARGDVLKQENVEKAA